MPEYQRAKTSDGRLIHISNVIKGDGQQYRCPACDGQMIPAMGKVMTHHFRHKATDNCSPETYLHLVAKYAIAELFNQRKASGETFYYERMHGVFCGPCSKTNEMPTFCHEEQQQHDLCKWYDTAHVEKSVDGYIGDVVLEGRHGSMLLEICVTHRCEPEKIKSGLKIIEISLKTEEQLEKILKACRLTDTSLENNCENRHCQEECCTTARVTSYGLKDNYTYLDRCIPKCWERHLYLKIFYKSGKTYDDFFPQKKVGILRRRQSVAALDVWYDSERKIGNYPPELAYRKKKDTETAASMSSMFSVSTSLSDREMIERLLPRSLF